MKIVNQTTVACLPDLNQACAPPIPKCRADERSYNLLVSSVVPDVTVDSFLRIQPYKTDKLIDNIVMHTRYINLRNSININGRIHIHIHRHELIKDLNS